jgi:hypothetical protein
MAHLTIVDKYKNVYAVREDGIVLARFQPDSFMLRGDFFYILPDMKNAITLDKKEFDRIFEIITTKDCERFN